MALLKHCYISFAVILYPVSVFVAGRAVTSPDRVTVGILRLWPKRCRFTTTPWGPCTLPKQTFASSPGATSPTEPNMESHTLSFVESGWTMLSFFNLIVYYCMLLSLSHMYVCMQYGGKERRRSCVCMPPQSCLLTWRQSSNAPSGGTVVTSIGIIFIVVKCFIFVNDMVH